MHRLLTTLGRGFKEKIGWKRLGIAASLLIIIFAVTTLVRTLKGVDTGDHPDRADGDRRPIASRWPRSAWSARFAR